MYASIVSSRPAASLPITQFNNKSVARKVFGPPCRLTRVTRATYAPVRAGMGPELDPLAAVATMAGFGVWWAGFAIENNIRQARAEETARKTAEEAEEKERRAVLVEKITGTLRPSSAAKAPRTRSAVEFRGPTFAGRAPLPNDNSDYGDV